MTMDAGAVPMSTASEPGNRRKGAASATGAGRALLLVVCGAGLVLAARAGLATWLGQDLAAGTSHARLMASRWGWSFGLPLALWWMILYVAAGFGLWWEGVARARCRFMPLLAATASLGALGLWYLLLVLTKTVRLGPQWFAIIGCGMLAGHLIFYLHPLRWRAAAVGFDQPAPGRSWVLPAGVWAAHVAGGVLLSVVVIGGAWLGPLPAAGRMTGVQLKAKEQLDSGPGPDRLVWPFNAEAPVPVHDLPLIGSPDAPYVIVSHFCYTQEVGRLNQAVLLDLKRQFGSQVVVLPLLYPLDASVNPHVPLDTSEKHPHAGDYARLATAVWLADRDKFEAMHRFLVNTDDPAGQAPLEDAKAEARRLVGAEALEAALRDPRVDRTLARMIAAKHRNRGLVLRADTGEPIATASDGAEASVMPAADISIEPCTIWRGIGPERMAMIVFGALNPQTMAVEFERMTDAIPTDDLDVIDPGLLDKLSD